MKADISRDTFDSKKHFSRVLMQQGRVQLDADWNEQSAILLHYLRTLASDLIGQHGGPEGSFEIQLSKDRKELTISAGHYYVDGILCENENDVSYFNQPYLPLVKGTPYHESSLPSGQFLIYLDVWERHVTYFEDTRLGEAALGGIDTATRSQVVWQVKLRKLTAAQAGNCAAAPLPIVSNALLIAGALKDRESDDPCIIEPDARYRGPENQLYRVEIHSGNIGEDETVDHEKTPTFKWSRENGSVLFPVISITESEDETEVRLANLGRDEKFSLCEGDWVELLDDAYTLHNRADTLLRIISIDRDEMSVTLEGTPTTPISEKPENHPLLRRWDQKAGNPQERGLSLNEADKAAEVVENETLMIEDGVQIQFSGPDDDESGKRKLAPKESKRAQPVREKERYGPIRGVYRTGDFWLIPARTATADVEWPKDSHFEPIPQPSRGIEHHYAPLGIVSGTGRAGVASCRCQLNPISECAEVKEIIKEIDKEDDKKEVEIDLKKEVEKKAKRVVKKAVKKK